MVYTNIDKNIDMSVAFLVEEDLICRANHICMCLFRWQDVNLL